MDVPAVIKTDLTWLQKHERLVLAVLGGAILWLAIGKIDTLIINHDAANLHQAQVVADKQEQINYNLAKQAEQQAAQYKVLAEQVAKQNAALEHANVQLSLALSKQQKTDATLTTTQLVERWESLVPNTDFNGTEVLPDEALGISHTNAVATVQELEKVPVLAKQYDNELAEVTADQKLIDAGAVQSRALTAQVSGLQLQLVDDAKVCKAQVAEVKAQARKGKRTWFTIGYVAGIATRGAIKLLAGI